jgi:rubrerythrin
MTGPYLSKDVHKFLQKSIKEESDTIRWYQQRAANARMAGYNKVAELYDHIRKEEEKHLDEFTQAIKELHL